MRYDDYEASRSTPNIVVDGSPNESTVLTLTHWPGIPAPAGLARDLSADNVGWTVLLLSQVWNSPNVVAENQWWLL